MWCNVAGSAISTAHTRIPLPLPPLKHWPADILTWACSARAELCGGEWRKSVDVLAAPRRPRARRFRPGAESKPTMPRSRDRLLGHRTCPASASRKVYHVTVVQHGKMPTTTNPVTPLGRRVHVSGAAVCSQTARHACGALTRGSIWDGPQCHRHDGPAGTCRPQQWPCSC